MRDCMRELVHLLKAKIQCIWIESYEEAEVIADLKEIVNNDFNGTKLFTWSFTEGLRRIAITKVETQEEPNAKITVEKVWQVIGQAQDNKDAKDEGFYVIKDLHLYNDGHQVKRALRDIKERKSDNYNPIIVIAPVISIPIEHEKLFTVIHYDTPNRTEITRLINRFVQNMQRALQKDPSKNLTIPSEDEVRHLISACMGLTYNEIMDVLSKSVIKYRELSLRAVMEAKIQLVEKSGVLDYKLPVAQFSQIGGNEEYKEWIEDIEASMTEEAQAFGCVQPKGYLALGVPGTAKTFLAEGLANKWGVPLLQLDMSKIMNRMVGESEKKVSQAFRIAKACAPCVFLWDEVEKALSGTKSSNASDAGTTARVFKACLEFLNDSNGVFVVMTSNDVSQLPPELTRSGRLDAMWYFSLPNLEERREIFRIHLNNTGKEISEDLINAAAEASEHYTGAEIKAIVQTAMRKAYKRYRQDGNDAITSEDVLASIPEIIPIYRSSQEKIEYLESWVHGRARYAGRRANAQGYVVEHDQQLANTLLTMDSLQNR